MLQWLHCSLFWQLLHAPSILHTFLEGFPHLSPLLGTGGCAAGAARCGSQQPPAAQQAQPGTRQAPGGHLELAEAPPGRHAAPDTASGGERVGLAEAAAAGVRYRKVKFLTIETCFEISFLLIFRRENLLNLCCSSWSDCSPHCLLTLVNSELLLC